MGKRKNGEGSYGKKTIKGKTYLYYRFPNGQYVYAMTSTELKQKKEEYIDKKLNQELISPAPKAHSVIENRGKTDFITYCLAWLPMKKDDLAISTYDSYESILQIYVGKRAIGAKEVREINPVILSNYLASLAEQYSKGTIDKVWRVLRQVVQFGQNKGDIQVFNIEEVRIPKERNVAVRKKNVRFITPDDMEKLYKEMSNPMFGDGAKVVCFLMYSGLRISEAIALTWADVAPDYGEITVRQSMTKTAERDSNGNVLLRENGTRIYKRGVKDPKSAAGHRTIPMPSRGQEILQYFDQMQHNDSDFVFRNSAGHPYDKRNISRTLSGMLRESDCSYKGYSPHCLRHGYGSYLLANGVDIKVVSTLLGHAKVTTTYDIYIGVLEDDVKRAVRNVFG